MNYSKASQAQSSTKLVSFQIFWIFLLPRRLIQIPFHTAKNSFYSFAAESDDDLGWQRRKENIRNIDFLQRKTLRYVISILAIKLSPKTQEHRAQNLWTRKHQEFSLIFKSKVSVLPAKVPSRWKRSRSCKGIFRQQQPRVQSHRATEECECLDAVQTTPKLNSLRFVDSLNCLWKIRELNGFN